MTGTLDKPLELINEGRHSESIEMLLDMLRGDKDSSHASFLLGCIYFGLSDSDAMKAFSMAHAKAPNNATYEFFLDLMSNTIAPPHGRKELVRNLETSSFHITKDPMLSPLPLAIITRYFINEARWSGAYNAYITFLDRLNLAEQKKIFELVCSATNTWHWDQSLCQIKNMIRNDCFTEEYLLVWIHFLTSTHSEKRMAMAQMMLLLFTEERNKKMGSKLINTKRAPAQFFKFPEVPNRILGVLPINGNMQLDNRFWLAPGPFEWATHVAN